MSYRHTLEAAVESLHEIEDLIKGFPENGTPAIEIDLALQKLRSLYELLLLLRNNNVPAISDGPGKSHPENVPSGAIAESKESSAILVVEENKKTTVAISSAIEDKQPYEHEEKTKAEPEKKEEKKVTGKTSLQVQTLADQFKGRQTLLETLTRHAEEDETFAHSRPVTDLMSAIALNDRFTFIRELFNNDKKAFEMTIAALNSAGSFNDAFSYIRNEFNWDMEGETVQLLLSFVRRKYTKGRHE